MADPRYFELWTKGRQPPPKLATEDKPHDSKPKEKKEPTLNIRLDVPGGISYAPDQTAPHNPQKRLFVPFRDDGTGRQFYNFQADLETRNSSTSTDDVRTSHDGANADADAVSPSHLTAQDGTTDAQKYMRSIDMTPRAPTIEEQFSALHLPEPLDASPSNGDRATIRTGLTTASTKTAKTARSLAAQLTSTGLAPRVVRDNMAITSTRVPGSIAGGDKVDTSRSAYRVMDAPTAEEKERGFTEYEERSGPGRAPALQPDSSDQTGWRKPKVGDEFVADPRPWRPLRLVRRTDPRQMLILCTGLELDKAQAATMVAARSKAVAASMLEGDTTELLKMFGDSEGARNRAGLGAYFVPPARKGEGEARLEPNLSRRLEMPSFEQKTSGRRAALRAVIAGLEYCRWEEEGFDKVVIGTSEWWIVSAITNDIWTWRKNGWTLTEESVMGMPGDSVPDRDLWELLDHVVKAYEKLDFTVRFWLLPRSETRPAKQLAEEGALKDNQQPGLVKWRKKKREDAQG